MKTPSVLVIFASDKGSTRLLGRAIYQGLKSSQLVNPTLTEITDGATVNLIEYDAVAIGSPTHMGSMHWKAKKFIDEVCGPLWSSQPMRGKFFSVFSTGGGFGGAGGGAELAMISMAANFVQLGMIFVPMTRSNKHFKAGGSAWGPYLRTNDINGEVIAPDINVIKCAELHGLAFAKVVSSFREGVFADL